MARLWLALVCCVASAACGSSHLGNGPCVGDASPSCGASCGIDTDCDLGFYCSAQGTCTADCTAGGNQCPSGQTCDDRGRCVDGDAGQADATDCPSIDVTFTPLLPTVVILIDQSGSMTTDFGGVSRYQAVRDALVGTGGVVVDLEAKVRFGATLYTGDGGSNCPILTAEPADLNNLVDIRTLLDGNAPASETPTGESLDAVRVDLVANPPPPDSPPFVVIATDGEPDTCAVPNPQNGQPEAIAAAQAAYAAGIEVFMLGVGDGTSDAHLQDMANAGVGLPLNTTTPAPFYRGNDPAQLTAAFQTIINGVRSCQLDLDGNVDPSHAGDGVVTMTIDGVSRTLVLGTDWQLIDSNTIELIGQACTDFLDQDNVSLDAEFPCGTVVP